MKKQIVFFLAMILLVGGVSFYGGIQYKQKQRSGFNTPANVTMTNQRQGNLQRDATVNGGFIVGEVISKDLDSITLKLQDRGSKIILISEATPVTQSAPGSIDDIKVGEQITVTGSSNEDGSFWASSIRIGDALFRMRN